MGAIGPRLDDSVGTERDIELIGRTAEQRRNIPADKVELMKLLYWEYKDMGAKAVNGIIVIAPIMPKEKKIIVADTKDDTQLSILQTNYHLIIDFDDSYDHPLTKKLHVGSRVLLQFAPGHMFLPDSLGKRDSRNKNVQLYRCHITDLAAISDGISTRELEDGYSASDCGGGDEPCQDRGKTEEGS